VSELVDGALASELGRLLTRVVNRGRGVRHGLLAVGDVGGSWIWRGAHGVADPDGTPVTVSMRYLVASVTKLYTSVVVMRLVERGLVTLEDRIVELLPADVTNGLHVLDGVDHTRGCPGCRGSWVRCPPGVGAS
jgi:CubicO group peptidase (beta-lactamase class C family)